jgi:hypothetical protein
VVHQSLKANGSSSTKMNRTGASSYYGGAIGSIGSMEAGNLAIMIRTFLKQAKHALFTRPEQVCVSACKS